jgi:hypothetical protein
MTSMTARSNASLALVLALAAGQACSDPTGSDRFVGTYQLTRYEGQTLPVTLQQTSAGSVSLIGERLVIGDNGKAHKSTTVHEVNAQTPLGAALSFAQQYAYVIRGSRIELTFICPPDADCIFVSPIVGERSGSSLSLSPAASSKPASTYARVR